MATACRQEIRRLGVAFDVVESPEYLAEGLLAGRTPVVVTLHTPLRVLSHYNNVPMGADRRIADRLERLLVERADAVISPSQLLIDELAATGWLERPAALVRLPIDLEAWCDLPPATETGPHILVVGRLEPRKAPELAVRAAHRLAPHHPGLRLTLMGRGSGHHQGVPYATWIANLAAAGPAEISLVEESSREEVRQAMAQARVVVVPSRFESFSMVALEAMAARRPVVCTSTVGAGELMARTYAGRVVANPEALADAIGPYLVDAIRAHAAGSAGRAIVEERCAPEAIAVHREAVYREVAA